MKQRVQVVVWSSVRKPLTYEAADLPAGEELLGRRVIVPLAGRRTVGLITGLDDDYQGSVKPVSEFCDTTPILSPHDLQVCRFISEYYSASLAESVKAWLPGALTRKLQERIILQAPDRLRELAANGEAELARLLTLFGKRVEVAGAKLAPIGQRTIRHLLTEGVLVRRWQLQESESRKSEFIISLTGAGDQVRLGSKGRAALEFLERQGEASLSQLRVELKLSPRTVSGLEQRGLIRLTEQPPFRADSTAMKSSDYRLTAAQRIAVEKINATIDSGGFAPFLLHGVTGSGKTEVYLRAVRRALALDRSSIIVVPEIGLAQAMYYRLEEEFASEVALLHSRLTQRSRLLLWEEIRAGQRRIVLGPRSSVFASVPRLGLIVVDEEHDQSLKQESPAPRYHARDVALYRARLEKCAVVLGSATPALESYHNALAGKYQLLQLPERVDKRPLPRVSVVNLRQEREAGRYDYLSEELLTEMKAALNQGGQVMLLLNRRGFSPSVHCHGCGERILCRHCAVTLVYHKRENVLLCHSCGYRQPYPRTCSACGGGLFLFRGIGTEKLTEVVSSHFPEVEVARMDLDTTRRKGSFAEVFDSFRNGRARILIGTQMIAKGFDFPDVALMGVISADTALELPDFRARERTFQLLTQAAGRAGRHSFMGRVLLQTLHPEDATIKLAVEHDYQSFYESEIVDREAVGFPPFRRLLLIALEGTDPVALQRAADWVASGLKSVKNKQFQVLGPVPAPVAMRRGRWRFQILIKTSRVKATLRSVNEIVQHKSLPGRTKLSIIVDVDPMTML